MRSWKILKWINEPINKAIFQLDCPNCETEAELPIQSDMGGIIIAAKGLNLFFDPPGFIPPINFMPNEIQCRHCHKVFSDKEIETCTESSSAALL